jgi:hypothetical protein
MDAPYTTPPAGADIADHLPEGWIERTEFLLRAEVPVTMSEPSEPPGRGDDEVPAIASAALEGHRSITQGRR